MLNAKEIKECRKIFNESDQTTTAAFKVLSDSNRYRIFRILSENKKLSISSIAHVLNISLPLASQHLKILTVAGLLKKEREGKNVFSKLERKNPIVPVIIETIKKTAKK